jgi:hypothetical protein
LSDLLVLQTLSNQANNFEFTLGETFSSGFVGIAPIRLLPRHFVKEITHGRAIQPNLTGMYLQHRLNKNPRFLILEENAYGPSLHGSLMTLLLNWRCQNEHTSIAGCLP